jgi:hypothetical protein
MSRRTITTEIDDDCEPLLRDYATFLEETEHLAKTPPYGTTLTACEQAVVDRDREHQRRVLAQAVQARIDDAKKARVAEPD